jgi:hypothetical protein
VEFVTFLAVLATGAGTLILAYYTQRSFHENRKLIDAAAEQARAAARQADASARQVAEVQQDREFAAAPYVKVEGGVYGVMVTAQGAIPSGLNVTVSNIGRGPALSCVYCACYQWDDPRHAEHPELRGSRTRNHAELGGRSGTISPCLGSQRARVCAGLNLEISRLRGDVQKSLKQHEPLRTAC